MGILYGRADRLTAESGDFRPGQNNDCNRGATNQGTPIFFVGTQALPPAIHS
jgi:hypothetical protein